MSNLRKAAEIAWNYFRNADDITVEGKQVMDALRQALAQPKQKIVDCVYPKCETAGGCNGPCGKKPVDTANTSQERETAPPKRWVGLTDEEIYHFVCNAESYLECAKGMEAKLKEKNT